MNTLFRHALSSLIIVAAGNAAAGVITHDGVVFTSTYTGNVLTLEIDAAQRSGGWATASAIDALGIKTIGSFGKVNMTSSTGASWALSSAELNASGCAGRGKGKGEGSRLCYSGGAVALADNMRFTFVFDGNPVLSAPHLKVHFVNAGGAKVGSLLSMDFPWQTETPALAPVLAPAPVAESGAQQGGGAAMDGAQGSKDTLPVATQPAVLDQALIPQAALPTMGGNSNQGSNSPVLLEEEEDESNDVPEPQSLAIIGAGLALMGLTRRRRTA